MGILIRSSVCTKEHWCKGLDICPVGAITQRDAATLPAIDAETCIVCGLCMNVCKKGAIDVLVEVTTASAVYY